MFAPTFARKLELRSPLGEEKYSPFPYTQLSKTEVRPLKGKGREGKGRTDLPCLIFIGNERISFAFFLPFVHDFARIITR